MSRPEYELSCSLEDMTHLRAAAYLSLSLRPPFSASPRSTLSLSLFAFARTCEAGSTYTITGHA